MQRSVVSESTPPPLNREQVFGGSGVPAMACAVLATIGLIVARRPDGIWNAQFWAEDGKTWYAQAYNEGALHALLLPAGGYLQSFSRLTAALSLAFDLRHAPLVFAVGSADGFSDELRQRADFVLSLGKMTLAHELARIVLLEQVYRAFTILKGHPYHLGH
jgi:23S rRNA (pseudouridine1915-N3)-methyltransferase